MGDELLIEQIKRLREYHDKNDLEKIIIKMKPLIKKYSKKLFFMDIEDAEQELILTLIESINFIKNYNNEAMCFSYLQKSIINKYNYLCKSNIKKSNIKKSSFNNEFIEGSDTIFFYENYGDLELSVDIRELLKYKNEIQKHIVKYILQDNLSDNEISLKLHVSRQYVNRVKKTIFREYLKK